MKNTIPAIIAAATVLTAVSCKEELEENGPVRLGNSGRIELSVDGIMGEYGDAAGTGTKASLVNNVRVAWQNGDDVCVYDGESYLGSLEAEIKDGDDRVAILSGSIDAPAGGTSVLTLVCCSGISASTAVGEGKISFDLSEQDGGEIPFVVYATVPFEGTDISGTAVPFKFATSVMKVNVTGLKAGCTVQNATVSGMNTRCVLTLSSGAAPAVSGDTMGTVTRSGDGAFSLSGDGRGTFQLATVVSPSSSGRTMDITDSSANIFSTGFTASALAAGKSYNSVYALRQMPALVDLGLPSGNKWADMNLGEMYTRGGYLYAWGETESCAPFNWGNYSFSDTGTGFMTKYTHTDGNTVLDAGDDAATAALGPGWRTPSAEDWVELFDRCEISVETVDGTRVATFTSKVSGFEDASIVLNFNDMYWTSSKWPTFNEEGSRKAQAMGLTSDLVVMLLPNDVDRCEGHFIRPIYSNPVEATSLSLRNFTVGIGEDEAVPYTLLPENCTEKGVIFEISDPSIANVSSAGMVTGLADGVVTLTATWADNPSITASCVVKVSAAASGAVDLGLTSGTKWASQDLQASSSFESGSPFTWTEDDAATASLGTGWSRPTTDDWEELMEECTWTWVPAINCIDVTGPSGNSILFVCPNDPGYPGTWYHATYWTSDLYPDSYVGAVRTVYLSWDDDKEPEERISHDFTIQSREDFYPIRPVFKQ